ncbi:putative aminopeptidase W07G4.4 [Lates japonicus]|uniref:Aminopeptidase W07G4.4 n=1 Tax=Lates japonicus TaxID=270547 RepID=A0AAD3NIX3_LATJO|nr:putative aminopeptidase W07G4.4 [Lates japonicus]
MVSFSISDRNRLACRDARWLRPQAYRHHSAAESSGSLETALWSEVKVLATWGSGKVSLSLAAVNAVPAVSLVPPRPELSSCEYGGTHQKDTHAGRSSVSMQYTADFMAEAKKHLKVVGSMAIVRTVWEQVRWGLSAEGRMVMVDLLCEMKKLERCWALLRCQHQARTTGSQEQNLSEDILQCNNFCLHPATPRTSDPALSSSYGLRRLDKHGVDSSTCPTRDIMGPAVLSQCPDRGPIVIMATNFILSDVLWSRKKKKLHNNHVEARGQGSILKKVLEALEGSDHRNLLGYQLVRHLPASMDSSHLPGQLTLQHDGF